MEDDAQVLDRITRRETRERVGNILAALRASSERPPWDEVYRHAHTLAGIADPVASEVAEAARNLATKLRDARGRLIEPSDAEASDEVREDLARLAAWFESQT